MATQTFSLQTSMPASARELYDWHERPGAFQRLMPPWDPVEVVDQESPFEDGRRASFRTRVLGPIKMKWVAEFHDVQPGRQFCDREIHGPFAEFDHSHRMHQDGPDASILDDSIEYRLPLGALGRLFGSGMVRRKLERVFTYRHRVTLRDLTRHAMFKDWARMTVAITGSRGMIGSALTHFLTTGGHQVVRLVHGKSGPPKHNDGTRWVEWDSQSKIDSSILNGCDAVVHLAGDNIADGRWSERKKKAILESRTGPTRRLAEAIAGMESPPKVFVSASATGIYGDRRDEELTEESSEGSGFLADVVRQWESAADPAKAKGVRVVHARFGVVLSSTGGALAKQMFAFNMGGGATLGSGKQWLSWVALNDVVGAVHHAIMTESLTGPVNVTAPNPVTNRTFGKTLGRVLGRPVFLWIPGFALRVLFGEMADAALLASARVLPRKLEQSGFAFDDAELEPALRHMLGR